MCSLKVHFKSEEFRCPCHSWIMPLGNTVCPSPIHSWWWWYCEERTLCIQEKILPSSCALCSRRACLGNSDSQADAPGTRMSQELFKNCCNPTCSLQAYDLACFMLYRLCLLFCQLKWASDPDYSSLLPALELSFVLWCPGVSQNLAWILFLHPCCSLLALTTPFCVHLIPKV